MELESYDYEPYDYGLEEEDFYENNPPTKANNGRRVTFNKRVFAKVCFCLYTLLIKKKITPIGVKNVLYSSIAKTIIHVICGLI